MRAELWRRTLPERVKAELIDFETLAERTFGSVRRHSSARISGEGNVKYTSYVKRRLNA